MNLLLVNFDINLKNKFSDIFYQTSLEDKRLTECDYNLIDGVLKSSNRLEIDLIVTKCIEEFSSQPFYTHGYKSIPILFLTEEEFNSKAVRKYNTQNLNVLPISELSVFTLEKCIVNAIDRVKISLKLEKIKKIESDLKLKEEKYNNLFENSSLGMYEVDANGNFVLANKVFLNMLGIKDAKELNNYNLFRSKISTNGKRKKLEEILKLNAEIINFEDEWLKIDNTKVQIKEHIKAKKDIYGNVNYYQGVVEDITERKKVEDDLIQSQREAQKSDKLKSEFLTQISHEIRTPINTLISFAKLIEDELSSSLSGDLRECFVHMNKAGKRTIRTIDLLVKMSELQTENYDPSFEENDLFEVLNSIVEDYKLEAKQKKLDLVFIKTVDSARLKFDKQTMQDVFHNLIDNAIKYTDQGSVKIYLKKSFTNKFTVTFLDTGIGISDKFIKNIFKPFSQESGGYTRKFDGNGLGLALVKEYCSLNNANIFVTSEKGSGSNFTVVFK